MLAGMQLLAATGFGAYTGRALWYATRGTGAVALVLLSAVVVLGVLGPLRLSTPRWPRFALSTLHRDLSLLAIAFVAVHVATTVLDGFAPIGWLAGIVPFQSPYRPLWLGLGTVAFDLLLALVITSLIRVWLGHRRWRKVHWLAYASWPIAAFHGLGTGTDAGQTWLLLLTAACATAILVAVLVRIRERWTAGTDARPWFALSVAIPLALFAFAVAGPLSPNWARRAGTPALLLGHSAPVTASSAGQNASSTSPGGGGAASPSATASTTTPAAPARPFSARLVGRIEQSSGPDGATIDLRLTLASGPPSERGGILRIRLAGRPLPGGGVALVGSEVDLISKGSSELTGSLTSLDGSHLTAQVLGATGAKLSLDANLAINQETGAVSGQLSATPGAE